MLASQLAARLHPADRPMGLDEDALCQGAKIGTPKVGNHKNIVGMQDTYLHPCIRKTFLEFPTLGSPIPVATPSLVLHDGLKDDTCTNLL